MMVVRLGIRDFACTAAEAARLMAALAPLIEVERNGGWRDPWTPTGRTALGEVHMEGGEVTAARPQAAEARGAAASAAPAGTAGSRTSPRRIGHQAPLALTYDPGAAGRR